RLPAALAAAVHARYAQLPDGGRRLHRRAAPVGVRGRAACAALCRARPAAGAPSHATAGRIHMSRSRLILAPVLLGLAVLIAGCSSTGTRKAGGYYQDDGPGANPPADLDNIPDAVPRLEPLASGANRPYTVFGKRYVPIADSDHPYKERGIASWYGKKFHGQRTSIGEVYDMYAMTAAHPTMPLPSYARVSSSINGRTVIVRVNDRGPFHSNRIMDLSYAAARKLGIIGPG